MPHSAASFNSSIHAPGSSSRAKIFSRRRSATSWYSARGDSRAWSEFIIMDNDAHDRPPPGCWQAPGSTMRVVASASRDDGVPHKQMSRRHWSRCMSQSREFRSATLEQWRQAAASAAPGGRLDGLNWVTPEGITVKPLYTAADIRELPHTDTLPGFEPF